MSFIHPRELNWFEGYNNLVYTELSLEMLARILRENGNLTCLLRY